LAAIGIALLWLGLVCLADLFFGNGRPIRGRVLLGLLLGRWQTWEAEPSHGELILIFLGRIGSGLVILILVKVVLDGNWLEAAVAFALLMAGLGGLALAAGRTMYLAGLTGVRTLLRLPDGYQFFLGQVAAGGPLSGSTLASLDLRRRGLLVLAVGHGGGRGFVQFPKGQEVLSAGELLVLYGRVESGANASET